MVLKTYMKLCVNEADFLEKKNFTPKIGKMDQKWTKDRVCLIY